MIGMRSEVITGMRLEVVIGRYEVRGDKNKENLFLIISDLHISGIISVNEICVTQFTAV